MEAGSTGFRVAIDGKDAAGKTKLADHLASALVGVRQRSSVRESTGGTTPKRFATSEVGLVPRATTWTPSI
jgi:hypothetical protein